MKSHSSVDHHGNYRYILERDKPVIRHVHDRFREPLQYGTYRLANKSSCYDEEVTRGVVKCVKHVQVQMRSQTLNLVDPIPTISFLSTFPLARNTNGVHRGLTDSLLQCLRGAPSQLRPAPALHNTQSHRHENERTVASYCEAVNYLLETYGN